MNTDAKLAGKRALVTGSGTGIGREIALEFARQGADVVLHYAHSGTGARVRRRRDPLAGTPLDRRSRRISTTWTRWRSWLGKPSNSSAASTAWSTTRASRSTSPSPRSTPEQFDRLYHVNVRAPYFLTQHVVREMLAQGGGAVCNITSIHGLSGRPSTACMPAPREPSSPRRVPWRWNSRIRAFASTPSRPAG